jgi:hypothetical protein
MHPNPSMDVIFGSGRSPYYIHSPGYRADSGGIRVMHSLCHALNSVGEEACIDVPNDDQHPTNPRLHTPRLSPDIIRGHAAAGRRPIGVYPEVFRGNPCGHSVVARLILSHPGFVFGSTVSTFHPTDMIFYHHRILQIKDLPGEELNVPPSDPMVFCPEPGQPRAGRLLYVNHLLRRGQDVPDLPFLKDCRVISPRESVPYSDLPAVFRSAELLFTFEYSSAVLEALLCGCPVVYLPGPMLSEPPVAHEYGCAWGYTEDQVQFAKETVAWERERYFERCASFRWMLDRFISITQGRARLVDLAMAAAGS